MTTIAPASNAVQRPAKPPGSPTEQSFLAILKQSEKQIAQALPKHLTAERMMRMAVTIYHKTPQLQKCSPLSIIAAVIQASELGLEISSPLGHAFIVPYAGQAQFQIGYKGYFELAYRTGKVSAFPMRVVYEHDQLEVEYGTEQRQLRRND